MSGEQEDQDGISADGKYLLIQVPEFDPDPAQGPRQGQPMTSFLRLGAYHKNWQSQPGADILESGITAVPEYQGGHLEDPYGDEVELGALEGPFLDDGRNREGGPGTIPKSQRQDNSQKLFTRGGWWDHSDGNRVTTTYGDKVEVIRGNYKLVVLGRQDDPGYAASLDASGGIIQDVGHSMSGASIRVEYREDKYNGVWHLENATLGFIQTEDFAGDQFEHFWGDKQYSTTGSEEGSVEKAGKTFGNPHILEKTWAEKIESYTGSKKRRIPEIYEETWAKETFSKTDVSGDSTEETYCGGTLKSITGSASDPVPKIEEETYVTTQVGTTVAGATTETTTVGVAMETTIAGVMGSLTVAGLNEELTINGHHGNLEVAALANDIFLGFHLDLKVGASREYKIGFHDDVSIPDKKKKKLKELNAGLDRLTAILKDQQSSLSFRMNSLALHLYGMQVAIGM